MKTLFTILTTFILVSASFNTEAQRSRHTGGNHERDNSSYQQQRHERVNVPSRNQVRNNSNNYERSITTRHQDGRFNAIDNRRVISNQSRRNDLAVLYDRGRQNNTTLTQQRVYRSNDVYRQRYPAPPVYNNYNNYYYGPGRPHAFMPGPRYRVRPRSFISINFGGYPYYYNDGFFYGSYGGYYQPIFPPPGISIRILPFGYRRIFIGANLFYYFNGVYYRNRDRDTYEVVDAPMGATISSLPKGAKSVIVNGEKLYELNGTYYKEDRNYKGEKVYTVVGKNGEINNDDTADANTAVPAPLHTGDIVNQLPGGSKVVTIDGKKLYQAPGNVYLEEQLNGSTVEYKVVGE